MIRVLKRFFVTGELIPTVVRSEGSAFTEIVASALTAIVPVRVRHFTGTK